MSHELPTPEEQRGLLAQLKTLIERQGSERFLRAPLVETTPRFFPDPWRPDLDGVRTLALRLLAYAGLGELDVEVEPFATEDEFTWTPGAAGVGHSRRKHGAAAWFRGIEGGVCLFGIELSLVTDPERLVEVLAHEVAHAWRFHHGLMVEDSEVEEELTDLTTVYLGFGLPTVNGTYRYRARGEMVGSMARTEWSFSQGGYLPLEAMSFLLAVQAVARRMDSGETRRLQRQLEPNQAASFHRALQALESEPDALAATLSLPPPERWPAPWTELPVPDALRGAPASPVEPRPVRTEDAPEIELPYNEGRPVFRHRRSSLWAMYFWPLAGLLLSIPLRFLLDTQASLLLVPAALFAAWRFRRDHCTGTDCDAILNAGVTVCPVCGGTVAGSIPRLRDRFDAEAQYWRKVRARGADVPEDEIDEDEVLEAPAKRDLAS